MNRTLTDDVTTRDEDVVEELLWPHSIARLYGEKASDYDGATQRRAACELNKQSAL